MSSLLVNTQSLIWHLFQPTKLSAKAKAALKTADSTVGASIHLSAISLIEILYLIEKGKFSNDLWTNTVAVVDDPATCWETLPIDDAIARSMDVIPRNIVPDMPDRIIATTAHVHQLPLVTSDGKIQQAPIVTIW